jgi:hypothetical protein
MWLIAFAGEFGDVVGQALPHGIFDTPEDTLDRDFPQSQGWCVLDFFLYLSGSVGGARFFREPTSSTLRRCKYERELFLKP